MSKTLVFADAWDGNQLKVTFRWCLNHDLMTKWYDILQIAHTLQLTEEDDQM
jgi:hypothetical protein